MNTGMFDASSFTTHLTCCREIENRDLGDPNLASIKKIAETFETYEPIKPIRKKNRKIMYSPFC